MSFGVRSLTLKRESRYIGLDILTRCRVAFPDGNQTTEEVALAAITA